MQRSKSRSQEIRDGARKQVVEVEGFVGLAKFGTQPDFWPDTQKKRAPKPRLPNLDPLLAEGKTRQHLEIFMRTRGVSILDVDKAIDRAIKRYNRKYPWTKYKERKPQQGPPLGGSGPRTSDAPVNTSHDPYPDGYIKPGAASQLEELKNANFGEVMEGGFGSVEHATESVSPGSHSSPGAKLNARQKAKEMHKQQRDYIRKKAAGYKMSDEYRARLEKAQEAHLKNIEAVNRSEQNVAHILREMRERDAATRQLQRVARGRQARKELAEKVKAREEAVTKIAAIQRGRQTRKARGEIEKQKRKMARGQRSPKLKSAPAGEDVSDYGSDDYETDKPMTEEEAAAKIQSIARGRQGRKRAQKQVRPFELSIGGFDFNHRGGQKTVGEFVRTRVPRERPSVAELTRLMLLNNPDEEELSIFHVIDADGDGVINSEDLSEYLEKIGERGHGPIELKDMIRELDSQKNGVVTQAEFVDYMRALRKEDKEKKRRSNIKKQIDSKTRRAFLIAKLEGRIGQKHPLNEEILPAKQKKVVEPVQIGFD